MHTLFSNTTYRILLLSLGAGLLGSCSRSQQLGVQDDPQEILNNKLRDPEAVLTPNQSITLLNHCAELGEQSAATATEKTVSIFVGNTGAGKSTTINALMGCRMREEIDGRDEEIIIVDPESPLGEVMPIGHGTRSRTFMPQIVQTPDESNSAYCDCPGFSDTRGAEINIANAINIRKVLQQATSVKAIFLTSYNGLSEDRGAGVKAMESMCHQMFGSADTIRKYQSSVLLGITKAPIYNRRGQPIAISSVRLKLTHQVNTPITQILANRIFLFDPLDRATDNPDFWSLAQCRNEIMKLPSIPQRSAITLFQTTLTDGDKMHLLNTIRQLQPKIVNAITQGDVTALGQHWQLLQRLRVIEHPELGQLIEGQVLPVVNIAILQKAEEVKSSTIVLDFDDAQQKLSELTDIVSQLPGVPLICNVDTLRKHVHNCQANKDDKDALKEHTNKLENLLKEAHKVMALLREKLDRIKDWEGVSFSDLLTVTWEGVKSGLKGLGKLFRRGDR